MSKNNKIYLYSIITEDDIEQADPWNCIEPKLNTKRTFKSKKAAANYVLKNTDWFWVHIYSFDGEDLTYELTIDDDGNIYDEDERKQAMVEDLGSEEAYNKFMAEMRDTLDEIISRKSGE